MKQLHYSVAEADINSDSDSSSSLLLMQFC